MIVVTDQPDITGIDKSRPVQVAQDRETVFEIGFELQVAGLIQITVCILFLRTIAARTNRTDRESTQAVRPTNIELLVVRRYAGISVTIDSSRHHTADQVLVMTDLIIVTDLRRSFHELGEFIPQQMLSFLIEFLSGNSITGSQQVTRL